MQYLRWKQVSRACLGLALMLGAASATGQAAEQDQAQAESPDQATLELGKKVFTELADPKCQVCHTLQDAGAQGEVGPSLDEIKPTAERVKRAVTGGFDIMPPYEDILSEEQIDALAHYVADVTGAKPDETAKR